MNRQVFSKLCRKTASITSIRFTRGLAVNEESTTEGSKLSPDIAEFNSGKLQTVKKQLYAWGLAEHGALGLEKFGNRHHEKTPRYRHKPTRHFFGEENVVTQVECGYGFTAYVLKTNQNVLKVYGSGLNTDSQVGCQEAKAGHPLGLLLSPVAVNLGIQNCSTNVISLSAGRAHLVVVTDTEGVFTLGSNCYGQCGRPIIQSEKFAGSTYIHNIPCLDGARVISVVCGQDHTLFLTEEGKVYSCGLGADGQTGLGVDENVSTPTRVCGDISEECIVKLVGKCDTIMALSNKGQVFGWGNTEYSQFTQENDDNTVIKCPIGVEKLRCAGNIIDIAAGGSFCMALNSVGEVFVWGYGILGAGPCVDKSVDPVVIPSALFGCNKFKPNTQVISITCGLSHMAAITNYCDLYTWGRNRDGCLGVGHVRDQYFPYKVCIGASVQRVSCGIDHTMALCEPFV